MLSAPHHSHHQYNTVMKGLNLGLSSPTSRFISHLGSVWPCGKANWPTPLAHHALLCLWDQQHGPVLTFLLHFTVIIRHWRDKGMGNSTCKHSSDSITIYTVIEPPRLLSYRYILPFVRWHNSTTKVSFAGNIKI